MKFVVDTNVIFSALLKRESKELFILKRSGFRFFIPKVVFIELFKYKEKLFKHSSFSTDEILELFYLVLSNVDVIDEFQIPFKFRKQAYELTKDVDIKDAVFVALALALDAKVWTGDKRLKEHLIRVNKGNLIVTTADILEILKRY